MQVGSETNESDTNHEQVSISISICNDEPSSITITSEDGPSYSALSITPLSTPRNDTQEVDRGEQTSGKAHHTFQYHRT